MTFITYAQNGEDILLWRALGHVKQGFYVDVGANDPIEHSVTKAFYDAGWRGINIEPLPSFHQRFEQDRPGDINLAIAAGAADGELKLYDVPSVNGWASPDAGVAAAHRAEGFDVVELTVPVRTLNGVWDEHVRGDVHFLKIDVEGFEGEVLRGFDLSRHRPWILVIEATLPNSRVTNHETWEPLVTAHGYRFAWFDGLNRYYVADEHAELLAELTVQPNVFDEYQSHHLIYERAQVAAARAAHADALQAYENALVQIENALGQVDAGRAELAAAQEQIEGLDERLREAHATVISRDRALAETSAYAELLERELAAANLRTVDVEYRLNEVLTSRSWKITEPLRAANAGELGAWVRARAAERVRRVVTRLVENEGLRRRVIPLLARYPALNHRVLSLVARLKRRPPEVAQEAREGNVAPHLRDLPVSARRAFADLSQRQHPPES